MRTEFVLLAKVSVPLAIMLVPLRKMLLFCEPAPKATAPLPDQSPLKCIFFAVALIRMAFPVPDTTILLGRVGTADAPELVKAPPFNVSAPVPRGVLLVEATASEIVPEL